MEMGIQTINNKCKKKEEINKIRLNKQDKIKGLKR
jgi:hypothetical protein